MRSQVTTPSSRREATILQEENDRLRELQIKEMQEEVNMKVQYEEDENNRKRREDFIEKIRDNIDDDIENPRITHK